MVCSVPLTVMVTMCGVTVVLGVVFADVVLVVRALSELSDTTVSVGAEVGAAEDGAVVCCDVGVSEGVFEVGAAVEELESDELEWGFDDEVGGVVSGCLFIF